MNGEYRIAKYGQWDGYRSGLGTAILNFLQTEFNRGKFIAGLQKFPLLTKAKINQFWTDAGANMATGMATFEAADKFQKAHPELSRDPSGADILRLIQEGKCEWSNPEVNFAADSLFCEWAYVIDLDKNTFEIYEGFNKTPLDSTERFAFLPQEQPDHRDPEYYPVRLLKSYSLRRLPTAKTMCKVPSWSTRRKSVKAKTGELQPA